MSRYGLCMCGATDCPSCGPAQGYTVVRRYVGGRLRWVNPEDFDEDGATDPDSPAEGDADDDPEAIEDCDAEHSQRLP